MITEYFIGGGADKNDLLAKVRGGGTGILDHLRLERKKQKSNITTFYRGHEQENAIFREIKLKKENNPELVINITGHSWGGHASLKLANRLAVEKISINELITLDPVSMTPFLRIFNFKKWVNVYQVQTALDVIATVPVAGNLISGVVSFASTFLPGHSLPDAIATTGGQLGKQTGAINICCTLDHADARGMYLMARAKMDNMAESIQ
jgi:pimeloyl-ACP methyl ester carboxylesterase